MLLAEAPCSLLKKRAPRLCKMLIFWTFRAPQGSQGAASKTLCFSHVFLAPRRQWGLQCFSQVLWLPKHCVFIGCWLLEGPGNSKKTLCLHRFSGSSGALGPPKPYVFIEALAPRGPWNSKALCHKFLSASRGAGELQNRMFFLKVFGLLGGFGGSKHLGFHM